MAELTRRSVFERVLDELGVPLDMLVRDAKAIALFGSRACGCEHPSSDWDLLCIGKGRSSKLGRIDLVWVGAHDVEGAAWLGGDLAGHVAAHGVWMHGEPSWRLADVRFDAAASFKERRLASRVRSLARTWELLGMAYQDKHAILLRRDIQRLELLHRHIAVPPTAFLDACWRPDSESCERIREILLFVGAEARLSSAITERLREMAGP